MLLTSFDSFNQFKTRNVWKCKWNKECSHNGNTSAIMLWGVHLNDGHTEAQAEQCLHNGDHNHHIRSMSTS